eukprot:4285925-Pleurochrysis_carterae.AAC.2
MKHSCSSSRMSATEAQKAQRKAHTHAGTRARPKSTCVRSGLAAGFDGVWLHGKRSKQTECETDREYGAASSKKAYMFTASKSPLPTLPLHPHAGKQLLHRNISLAKRDS